MGSPGAFDLHFTFVVNFGDWAAWFQAIGTIGAVAAAVWISNRDKRDASERRLVKGQALAVRLYPELLELLSTFPDRLATVRKLPPQPWWRETEKPWRGTAPNGLFEIKGFDVIVTSASRATLLSPDIGRRLVAVVALFDRFNRDVERVIITGSRRADNDTLRAYEHHANDLRQVADGLYTMIKQLKLDIEGVIESAYPGSVGKLTGLQP